MATLKLYYTDRNSTYKEWELIPNKLLIVDNIVQYLATKSALTINDIQYIKNDLEIGVNLDLSQDYSQPLSSLSFKYVSILNSAIELTHYYFVKKIIWRSKSAVRLELVLDVLNTFQEGLDYEWKGNTRIIREHKDRIYRSHFTIRFTTDTSVTTTGRIYEDDEVYIRKAGVNIYKGVYKGGSGLYRDVELDSSITYTEFKANWSRIQTGFTIYKDASNYISIAGTLTYAITNSDFMRKIDFNSEGINPLLINKKGLTQIENPAQALALDWYLLYRNQNDPSESQVNPVECYLIPELSLNTNVSYITNGRLLPTNLVEGKWYWFKLASGQNATLSNSVVASPILFTRLLITKAENKINIICFHLVLKNLEYKIVVDFQYDDIDYIDFTGLPIDYNRYDSSPTITSSFITDTSVDQHQFTNSTTGAYVNSINDLDRTDAKNIKLIKLPYCPYNFASSGYTLLIAGDPNWCYDSFTQANGGIFKALKLIRLNTKLSSSFYISSVGVFNSLAPTLEAGDRALTNLRKPNSYLESKLYHSEFFQPTFFYDSFAYKMDLEKCDMAYYENATLSSVGIKFNVTRTINSKFLFSFANYNIDKSEVNIYNALPIARNNEEVLYNVPYIQYVRTGFNYDIKSKNAQNISNYVGLGLSVASVGASLLAPSVPLKVAGVVASLVSVAMSIKNTIVTTIQNENAIKQKIQQLQNQTSSVAGSDDVDLMSEYCDNRMQYALYEPTDNMYNLLGDLFFYAGYSSNRMGIPNHHTRVNFDYLECEAQIQAISSIPDECLTELINCFKSGVTYIHKTTRTSHAWDFEQKYENWEVEVMD